MEKSNLFSLLSTFTKAELKEFDKFLRSPFFTESRGLRHKIIYSYFKSISKYLPDFTSKIDKTEVFSQLYPGKKYNDGITRKINSDLCSLAEEFLVQIEINENPKMRRRFRLIQLHKRKSEKLYIARFREMTSYLESAEKDEEYYYEKYNTYKYHYGFYYSSKNMYKLNESVNFLGNYFIYVIMASLSIYLWALSISRTTINRQNLRLYKEIMQHVEQNYNEFVSVPQIQIYYKLIRLTADYGENHFNDLKILKKKHFNKLSLLDKYNLHIMMTNYCHDRINKGLTLYRNERFLLDKDYLKYELYKESGFHISYFLAIAKNAIKLGKSAWVRSFCENTIHLLDPGLKDFAYDYIKAEIAFTEKNYSLALDLLAKLKINQSNHKQSAKNLLLQIYYETHNDEAALFLIDSAKHFIQHDKHLSSIARENTGNFIKCTEKLIKLRNSSDINGFYEIRKKITGAENMHNREWLIEMAELLINGK